MAESKENKEVQEEAVSTEVKAADEKVEKKIDKEPKKTTKRASAKKAADSTKKTTTRKSPAKKTTAKKAEPTIGMTLQGPNQEFDIIERIKNDWTEKGHKISEIEHIQTYVKLCDSAVYYVINGNPELKGAIYY